MKHPCVICGRECGRIIIENASALSARYDVEYCDRCEVGKTTPIPSTEELARFYSAGSYRSGTGERFRGPVEWLIYLGRLQRMRRISRTVDRGRILDIGCGRGLFLDIMRRHGWNVQGVEFDRESATRASATFGVAVIGQGEMRSSLPDALFDVVTMYHVLEHVPDPAEMICQCGRVLARGGLLVVSVPNLHSFQSRIGGRNWFHLDPPYHLHHFSEAGLKRLLEKHSFVIQTVRRFDWEYDVFGWLQTLLNRSGTGKNTLYEFLKSGETRKGGPSHRTARSLLLTFLLLPLYIPLSLVLFLADSFLFGKGGTTEIHAIKS